MVLLNKVYTRSGDDGTTALGTGERINKDNLRIRAYGTIDETNCAIGIATAVLTKNEQELICMLQRVQNDLFDVGADLCIPDRREELSNESLRVTAAQVVKLESDIDKLNKKLKPLTSFILPGGTLASSTLHQARTVCRRAEREIVSLISIKSENVSKDVLKYVNRLSDFLFVAARFANGCGEKDILWIPGHNR
ncbi:MAG: cob(I)yrinic acid a,c-diamide adenosyltransferase [Hyphomicrobiaceae bacterium]|nr:cob(I)yrinic acid a,c-diamide adenosyltransferase [Hyphomicrobiaceae bacterium]